MTIEDIERELDRFETGNGLIGRGHVARIRLCSQTPRGNIFIAPWIDLEDPEAFLHLSNPEKREMLVHPDDWNAIDFHLPTASPMALHGIPVVAEAVDE